MNILLHAASILQVITGGGRIKDGQQLSVRMRAYRGKRKNGRRYFVLHPVGTWRGAGRAITVAEPSARKTTRKRRRSRSK